MQISRKDISNGIALNTVKTDKFKFNRIFIDFILPLEREHAAENALFASVLLRGTKEHPSLLSIQQKLSSMYGAIMDSYVETRGEAHVITVYSKFLDNAFALGNEDITAEATSLLSEVITEPKTENGVFDASFVESEKQKLINAIEAQINDKNAFALKRCIQVMCEKEAWGVSHAGEVEDVEKITPSSLFERYRYILSHAKIEVWAIGTVDEQKTEEWVRDMFKNTERGEVPDHSTKIIKDVEKIKTVCEHQNIAQGKLVLGFRTGVGGYDDDIYAMRVLCSIFGSGTQSKLFCNVREKLSLCYFCSSSIYMKGVMTVISGIEPKNKEKAESEILAQLEAIKNGDITEEELENAKKGIRNAFLNIEDRPERIHSHYLGGEIFNTVESPAEAIEKVESVTVEQIVKIAKNIKLDTEYFLCGTECEE